MRISQCLLWISVCASLMFSPTYADGGSTARPNSACDAWVSNLTYAQGSHVTYQGLGYEAARLVTLNTPPIPGDTWFWTPYAACNALLPPDNLSYSTNPANYTVGVAITTNSPAYTGGTPISYTVAPSLPTGLNLDGTTGTISGIPSVAKVQTDYVVTAGNSAGSTKDTVKISVTGVLLPPSSLTYSNNPASYTTGTAITPNYPLFSGGTPTAFVVDPTLPTGLSLHATTGTISGTPTVASAQTDYVVTASNGAGSTTSIVKITIAAALLPPSNLTYSSNPVSYSVGIAIPSNNPTVSGGAPTGYTVAPSLPNGLTLHPSTGVISGIPTTASGQTNYVVSASNSAGSTTNTLKITVVTAPTNLTYSSNPASYTAGTAITPNVPSSTGGVPTAYSLGSSLPTGLNLDTLTGIISGTPSTASPQADYIITTKNSAGSTNSTLKITIAAALLPPSDLKYATVSALYTERQAITPNNPTVNGTVQHYSINPPLPWGLTCDTTTGIISGIPLMAADSLDYTITASNYAGNATFILGLRVKGSPPAHLKYPLDTLKFLTNVDIQPSIPTVEGSVFNYTVTPALPSGLILDESSGMIWGRPTVITPAKNYSIMASNAVGSDTATLLIEITSSVAIKHSRSNHKLAAQIRGTESRFSFIQSNAVRLKMFDLRGREIWIQEELPIPTK